MIIMTKKDTHEIHSLSHSCANIIKIEKNNWTKVKKMKILYRN